MGARSKADAVIAGQRLLRQGIADARFATPVDAVSWLLAVQAQDYSSSLWAVGLRMRDGSEAEVERAIANATLIRTWPMRGTLHLVAADDVRWLLELLAPRVIARSSALMARLFGLDAVTLKQCRRVVSHALRDGTPMRRNDLYAALDAAGIATAQRGTHITGQLAMEGLICGGPRDGRQPTFVLFDAWAPHAQRKPRDASLAELALRYFASRGPATAQDLAWWSGLTVKDALAAIALAGNGLVQETIDGKAHWHASCSTLPEGSSKPAASVHLLPPFDEYLVGYRDRSAAIDIEHNRTVIAINGLFNASIVVDGRIAGLWKRTPGKTSVALELQPFRSLPKSRLPVLRAAAKRYGAFVGMPVEFA
jgi:hypothetical protein